MVLEKKFGLQVIHCSYFVLKRRISSEFLESVISEKTKMQSLSKFVFICGYSMNDPDACGKFVFFGKKVIEKVNCGNSHYFLFFNGIKPLAKVKI